MIEIVKLFLMIGVILYFYVKGKYHLLLGITIAYALLEGLNPNLGANLQATHIIGVIFFIDLFRGKIKKSTLNKSYVKLLLFWLTLLVFLMFIYGWLFPWVDTSGERGWNQQAQGRSIIFTIGMMLQIFSFIYFSSKNFSSKQFYKTINIIVFTLFLCALFTFLDVLGIEIFNILNPSASRDIGFGIINRARGIQGEPRVNSQVLAFGIITLFIFNNIKYRRYLIIILMIAFYYSMSLSGIIFILVGVGVLFFSGTFYKKNKRGIIAILIAIPIGFSIPQVSNKVFSGFNKYLLSKSVHINDHGGFEVFDASAISFLIDNPEYLFLGTGPGLISLPASDYIPLYAQRIYGNKIDSIPHMGIIQLVANTGFIGLFIWIIYFYKVYNNLKYMSKYQSNHLPSNLLKYSLILFIIYLLQVKIFILLMMAFLLTLKPIRGVSSER